MIISVADINPFLHGASPDSIISGYFTTVYPCIASSTENTNARGYSPRHINIASSYRLFTNQKFSYTPRSQNPIL